VTDTYYQKKLAAERLKKCYEIASPRVQQYFRAEMYHVLEHIVPGDTVLDLGCGFGRVLPALSEKAAQVIGLDNALSSLMFAKENSQQLGNCSLVLANALYPCFQDHSFDVVVCIQNGISAFHVDPKELLRASIGITKPKGMVLFSSYADKFWEHRLEWFERQADEGLLGEIDWKQTGNGVIICKDGFKATTMSASGFLKLSKELGVNAKIVEVDESCIFCEIIV